MSTYVLAMELFADGKYRAYSTAVFEGCWAGGVMTLALIAWLGKNWRYVQLGITLPVVLSLSYIW